jgi:hypothetical protein
MGGAIVTAIEHGQRLVGGGIVKAHRSLQGRLRANIGYIVSIDETGPSLFIFFGGGDQWRPGALDSVSVPNLSVNMR